ncbi:MAG: metallophosphoesterase, partial [Methanoregula sp.]
PPITAGSASPKPSRTYARRRTGTWRPPLLFPPPPEVTIFELIPEE